LVVIVRSSTQFAIQQSVRFDAGLVRIIIIEPRSTGPAALGRFAPE
jgi:hypothetical protein